MAGAELFNQNICGSVFRKLLFNKKWVRGIHWNLQSYVCQFAFFSWEALKNLWFFQKQKKHRSLILWPQNTTPKYFLIYLTIFPLNKFLFSFVKNVKGRGGGFAGPPPLKLSIYCLPFLTVSDICTVYNTYFTWSWNIDFN